MKPKVSIIVPVYNVEKQLSKCLDSLVSQTLKDIEIILVNDGSPDNSQQIIDKYKKKYPDKIKSFKKENGGLSDARNFGLIRAKGEYILFVDSDDYIEINACNTFYECAKKDNLDVLIGNYIDVNNIIENKNINHMDSEIYDGISFIKRYFSQSETPIMAWLLFSKREFLLKNKLFFKKGIFHEDEHLVPTIMLKAKKIKFINYHFYYYINNPNSITKKKDKTKNIIDIYEICDELYKKYQSIKDDKVKKLLIDRLVYIRLLAFGMQNKYDKKFCFEKKLIWNKAYKRKNKLKAFIYCTSPYGYYLLLKLKKRG